MCKFEDYLSEAGISDSRHWSLRNAFNQMHTAYCELDRNNRRNFDATFGSGVREALIIYAQRRDMLDARLRTHVPQEELIREMSPSNRIIDLETNRYIEEDQD